ncbi:secreted protein [Geopyxis carbonaria]|nr:secreted protein [Geopyxis carbonaria]
MFTLLLFFLLPFLATGAPIFGLVGSPNAVLQLNGFHFISGAPSHYLHANHHCAIMSTSFIQCAIYVPDSSPARLAGIEYIITADAFAELPEDEKALWHSHRYEVMSGLLIQPGLPDNVDDAVMAILVNSYGKTWHTWRWDQRHNSLPLGIPELVSGYTGTGQLSEATVRKRDKEFGVDSKKVARRRAKNLEKSAESVLPGADSWRDGYVLNLGLTNFTGMICMGYQRVRVNSYGSCIM